MAHTGSYTTGCDIDQLVRVSSDETPLTTVSTEMASFVSKRMWNRQRAGCHSQTIARAYRTRFDCILRPPDGCALGS
jgi:hypothetical protein